MGCTVSTWSETKEVQLNDKLTQRQIQIIRDTWALISDDVEGTGVLIFNRLFSTDHQLKSLFVRIAREESLSATPHPDRDSLCNVFKPDTDSCADRAADVTEQDASLKPGCPIKSSKSSLRSSTDRGRPELLSVTSQSQEPDPQLDEYALKKHAKVVMEALGATVECLDDSIFLSNILIALGQIHCGYQVRPSYLSPNLWYYMVVDLKGLYCSKMKIGIRRERAANSQRSGTSSSMSSTWAPEDSTTGL